MVRTLAIVLTLILFPAFSFAETASPKISFGVVPQQSATKLAKTWVPFLAKVSEASGADLVFTTAKDIPTFEKCLNQGAYDLAYMNPYHYVEFHKAPKYQAFAHQRDAKLKGILVAANDSGVKRLEDLSGKGIAFPSPAAFGASVLPQAELRQRGIDFKPHYVKSHDSVYRAVATGIYPAGGGVTRTFAGIPDDLRGKLHIIYETKEYTPHAFAAHPRVDTRIVAAVAKAMAALPAASEELEAIGMLGIDPARDEEWDDIRALHLTRDETNLVGGTSECRSD